MGMEDMIVPQLRRQAGNEDYDEDDDDVAQDDFAPTAIIWS